MKKIVLSTHVLIGLLLVFPNLIFAKALPSANIRNNEASLALNELMSSNSSFIADEDGEYSDWIEIYNYGENNIDLTGFGLSDKDNEPFRWVFPNVNLAPGQFMLIWASGKDKSNPANPLHTNFSIKAEGEEVLITDPGGDLVDVFEPIAVPTDKSYGRYPNGTGLCFFFDEPTPGFANSEPSFQEILSPPIFSVPGGFYTEGFELSLSHPDPDVTIIYTLDGSEPDINNLDGTTYLYKNSYPKSPGNPFGPFLNSSYQSILYDYPIEIYDRSVEDDKITQMSSTNDYIPRYFPDSPVKKGMVIRARAYKAGFLCSQSVTITYFVFPEGRNIFSLPVASLNITEDLLFDYYIGTYTAGIDFDHYREENPDLSPGMRIGNFQREGSEWEYPSNFEFFDSNSSMSAINQKLGYRIHGGLSRGSPSKTLRFYARTEYGQNHINFPFFKEQPHSFFKRILLRNTGQNFGYSMIKDESIQEICSKLNFDTQAHQPVVAFINGEYWGILTLRERYDKYYLERVYGVDPDHVDILEANGTVVEGSNSEFIALVNYATRNSLAEDSAFEYVSNIVDINNLSDYYISEIFFRNHDWPQNNNKYWRYQVTGYDPCAPYGHDGRWRWLMYDLDYAFPTNTGAPDDNSLEWALQSTISSSRLFRSMLDNECFKKRLYQ